jgi:hypothetical protein
MKAHDLEISKPVSYTGCTLPRLVVSKAPRRGSAGFPCCPTSGPLQGPLYRNQLPVCHIAHHSLRNLFASAVGGSASRVFLRGCRPDIAYQVGALTRVTHCFNDEHIAAARHLLRYLRTTRDLQLVCTRNPDRTPPPMTPKPGPTTPHRQLSGS